MEQATEISLQHWLDPQGDSIVIYSSRECLVFRGCWAGPGEPADFIACLSFSGVAGVRCFPREFSPYPHLQASNRSSIWCLSDTDLIRQHSVYRQSHYPGAKGGDTELRHYVIVGHDFYHEILSDGFTETAIQAADIIDERLKRLLLDS